MSVVLSVTDSCLVVVVSGVHLQAECSHPAEGASDAPEQRLGGGGHGGAGGPPRRRHHAQPVPTLPAETHLREFPLVFMRPKVNW